MRRECRGRILWLIKGLGPGGAERLLLAAARARDRTAFDYEVAFLLPWKSALVPEFESSGVPVHCLDAPHEWNLAWGLRLRELLRAGRFDVVHSHSPYPASIARLVALTLRRSDRPRLIVTEHNAWPTYVWPTRLLNRATTPIDDATIAVSDHVAESVRGATREHVEVVVHGIALDDARALKSERESVRTEFGVASDEVLIGTIANYLPQKDYGNLFAAVSQLSDRNPRVRLCAVGQGPLEAEIKALRSTMGLDETVILTGLRKDAVRVMAGCDVFVLASRFEGFPVALMEALALGLPVVATRVGGVMQAIRDGTDGLLVPPRRSDLLADAIQRLVDDEDLRAGLGDAAARRSAEFDVMRSTSRIEAIYDRVLGR